MLTNTPTTAWAQVGWWEFSGGVSNRHTFEQVNEPTFGFHTNEEATPQYEPINASTYYTTTDNLTGAGNLTFQIYTPSNGHNFVSSFSPTAYFVADASQIESEVNNYGSQTSGDILTQAPMADSNYFANGAWNQYYPNPPDSGTATGSHKLFFGSSTAAVSGQGGTYTGWDWACPNAVIDTVTNDGQRHVMWSHGNLTSTGTVKDPNGRGSASPAVTHYGNLAYHFVVGDDQKLYAMTDNMSSWKLTSASATCLDNPAAYIYGTTLYVACEGNDHALWTASATINGGSCNGLPFACLNTWTSSTGVLIGGPAIANVGGPITVFAPGSDDHIWSVRFGASTGWQQFSDTTYHHVAIGDYNGGDVLAYTGTDQHAYLKRYGGGVWGSPESLGGTVLDGPGVAYAPNGGVSIFVEGADSNLYGTHVTASNVGDGWNLDGRQAYHGVAATQFLANS